MAQITITLEMTPENLEKLKVLCITTEPEKKAPKKKDKPADEPVQMTIDDLPKEDPKPDEVPWKDEKKDEPVKVSLSDVRAVALKLSKAGQQETLKNAFAKFGGKKLSDIKEEDYAALLKELNGGADNA